MTTKTKITGEISNITYRNNDGWSVFSVTVLVEDIKKARTIAELLAEVKCTGTLAEMCDVWTTVTCTGVFEDGKYGRQLKCESVVPEAPDVKTEAGVQKLLERLPGIGPAKAKRAVEKFGHEKAWRLACEDPEQIGVRDYLADEAMRIASSLCDGYEATVYLLGIGLTDHQANKVIKQYGKTAVEVVSENPYTLLEIDGFGFLTVDQIALKAGCKVGNPSRIRACVLYILEDGATNNGHIWHQGWGLADLVLEILTSGAMKAEVPLRDIPTIQDIRREVHHLGAEKAVVINKGRVFSTALLKAEQTILEYMSW